MKINFKNIIKNNKKIFYAALCLKNMKNEDFINKVLEIGHDMSSVEIVSAAGKEHQLPYVIDVGSSTIGFFALLRIAINGIAYADYFGLSPVVIFKDCVSYKENEPINGKSNPFEYYFVQPTSCDDDVYSYINKQTSYLRCTETHYSKIFELYKLKEIEGYLLESEHYHFYANIVKKYIRYNTTTVKMLNDHISELGIVQPFIGVHYRGTDFKNNYGSHPVSIGVAEYIESIKRLPKKFNSYPIFLATDDSLALEEFVKEFGSRVVFYHDVKRSDGKLSVICSEDERKNHKYLLGYEVIRDVETLSRANVLVAGLSQVATFARIFKLSHDKEFEFDKLMSLGVNHNNRSHTVDIEKARLGK